MADAFSRRDVVRMTRGLRRFPSVASRHIYAAQQKNAQEARGYMQTLVPKDQGVTKSHSIAAAYRHESGGAIGFAMKTSRPNAPGATSENKLERIKAILFANETDFFYAVWNLNKSRWRGRMSRSMTKSAREIVGAI